MFAFISFRILSFRTSRGISELLVSRSHRFSRSDSIDVSRIDIPESDIDILVPATMILRAKISAKYQLT